MHDPVLVRGDEAVRDLHGEVRCLRRPNRAAAQPVAQRLAAQQLGHDVRLAFVLADVVHVDDVGIVQGTGRTGFSREPAQLGLVVWPREKHLDRDIAREAQVVGAKDPAHPAAPDLAAQDVAAGKDRIRRDRRRIATIASRRGGQAVGIALRHRGPPAEACALRDPCVKEAGRKPRLASEDRPADARDRREKPYARSAPFRTDAIWELRKLLVSPAA